MGYWGSHPMAGDSPLDWESVIMGFLFDDPEQMDGDNNDAEVTRRLSEQLPEVYEKWVAKFGDLGEEENYETVDPRLGFVLPFMMADLGVRTTDPQLSLKLKALIGDGGAELRGYKPGGNDEDSPARYAAILRENWDQFMAGGDHGVPQDIGLVPTIIARNLGTDGNDGLVNTK